MFEVRCKHVLQNGKICDKLLARWSGVPPDGETYVEIKCPRCGTLNKYPANAKSVGKAEKPD